MLQCYAAGLYLLDESTTNLKLRAHSGLVPDALVRPARPLEKTTADVEALAGQAIVIENARDSGHWQIPEPCESAICVPVSSATTILGTLWLFRDVQRDFSPTEQNLAEITAGRLAADLERAVLEQEVKRLRGSLKVGHEIQQWNDTHTGRAAPALDGWDVAEASTSGSVYDFCHWHLSQQDRLHLSLGASHAATGRHLASVALQSSLAAHVQHDLPPKDLIHRLNESLWSGSTTGQRASLFHANLDPESGALRYAISGSVFAYVIRPHGWEPLLSSSDNLGQDDEVSVDVHRQVLMPGDILFAISSADGTRFSEAEGRANTVAEKLLHNTHLPAQELADMAAWAADAWRPTDGNALATTVMKRGDSKPR